MSLIHTYAVRFFGDSVVRHVFSLTSASLLLGVIGQVASAGELNFASDSATVSENGSALVISVERSGTADAAASVTVESTDGTAVAPADYNAVSSVLSWTAGDLEPKTVNLVINDDALSEGDQTLTLELKNAVDDEIGSVSTLTVTIIDYEEGSLQFSADKYSAVEDDDTVLVRISRINGADGDVGVTLKSTDGSAKSPADYTAIDTEVIFTDGRDTVNFRVDLNNDEVGELTESFALTLSVATGGARLGTRSTASVEIRDIDTDFTSTVTVIEASTDLITQPEAVDLKQPSLVDPEQTYLQLINNIPVLQTGKIEIAQLPSGLIEIPLGDDKFYFRPGKIRRNLSSAQPGITLGANGTAIFIIDSQLIIEAEPALAGISVLQNWLTELSLPEITITEEGNLTIQADQGPPPIVINSNGEVMINNSFYDRWNFRPLSLATLSSAVSEESGLLPHPNFIGESLVYVNFKDGSEFRQQLLSPAPVNYAELESALRSRLGVVAVRFREFGQVDFGVVGNSFAGFDNASYFRLFADYMIRRVNNFNTGMVGLKNATDVNGDGVNDFRMIYPNGEEQYFFTVEVGTQ